VVSVTDPYGRILGFQDRSLYFSIIIIIIIIISVFTLSMLLLLSHIRLEFIQFDVHRGQPCH
jgi:hypothetical protein